MGLYYETHGSGEPLILLHQFGAAGRVWKPFLPELARHYRVVVIDLPGHGRSADPEGSFTHRQAAVEVFALLDRIGITRFRAMGISTGGMILLHMATQQPGRVEAMVLISATTHFPESARALMRSAVDVQSRVLGDDETMKRLHVRGDRQIEALYRQFHGFKDRYDDVNFTAPYLAVITARTLIIHGDRDAFFPVEIPVEMHRDIPDAELWLISDGAHIPIYDPRVPFVPTVLRFLKSD